MYKFNSENEEVNFLITLFLSEETNDILLTFHSLKKTPFLNYENLDDDFN